MEQLAKALLAGNVRAQLTTIAAGDQGADESKVHSSVVSYLSPRGECPKLPLPAVWVLVAHAQLVPVRIA